VHNTVNRISDHLLFIFFFALAVLNPIQRNSTCYPGILCDGTENDFYDCKYDRAQVAKNTRDLFAVITRCIGKIVLVFFCFF
jgi:hypothetical protein